MNKTSFVNHVFDKTQQTTAEIGNVLLKFWPLCSERINISERASTS